MGETHVHISNTNVKPRAADGSAMYCGVRVGDRQAFFFDCLSGLFLPCSTFPNYYFLFNVFLNFVIFSSIICLLNSNPLQFGIDVLQENNFKDLENAGIVGFLTHMASTNSDNIPSCDIFIEANKDKNRLNGRLKCFFSPEHGFWNKNDAGVNISEMKFIKV